MASQSYSAMAETRAVKWKVWGERKRITNNSCAPVGYSQHMDGSTILDTYHYTRTYLEDLSGRVGDSGKVWGYGTVRAQGDDCLDEVWYVTKHVVKYGIED